MPIKTLALILLTGRIVAVLFNVLVVKRQLELFKLPVAPELEEARIILFALAVAALAFNIIPTSIDILTLTSSLARSSNVVNSIGILYSINACLASVVMAIFVWLLYRLAARTVILVDRDKYIALHKK